MVLMALGIIRFIAAEALHESHRQPKQTTSLCNDNNETHHHCKYKVQHTVCHHLFVFFLCGALVVVTPKNVKTLTTMQAQQLLCVFVTPVNIANKPLPLYYHTNEYFGCFFIAQCSTHLK
jgi:hypothetical protein